MAALLDLAAGGDLTGGNGIILLVAVSALMVAVGVLASIGPAQRGLRISQRMR